MKTEIIPFKKKGKLFWAISCLLLLGIIGFFDAIIDYRVSLTVFDILPLGLATLYVGTTFAVVLAVASVLGLAWGGYLGWSPLCQSFNG